MASIIDFPEFSHNEEKYIFIAVQAYFSQYESAPTSICEGLYLLRYNKNEVAQNEQELLKKLQLFTEVSLLGLVDSDYIVSPEQQALLKFTSAF